MIQGKTMTVAPMQPIVRLPSPYYDEDGITIYCGDCLEILPFIESVDVTFSSPPYNTIAATAPSGMMAEHNHTSREFESLDRSVKVKERIATNGKTIYRL